MTKPTYRPGRHYVDRLMADADGALATIWVTGILTLTVPAEASAARIAELRSGYLALVHETPRLETRWHAASARWLPTKRTQEQREGGFRVMSMHGRRALIDACLASPIDLVREIPLRATCTQEGDRLVLVLQLHHALGDARSLLFLHRRLWSLAIENAPKAPRVQDAAMTDRLVLKALSKNAHALLSLRRPEHRAMAPRGLRLPLHSTTIGAPRVQSLVVTLPQRTPAARRMAIFFAAVLAGIRAMKPVGNLPVRLRVPVDLRRAVGIGTTLENAVTAMPVEVAQDVLEAHWPDTEAFLKLVPNAVAAQLQEGVHWAALGQSLAISRIATRSMLRAHLRPDLIAEARANTMVVTYLGKVDSYFEGVPAPIDSLITHTPTWGANGFTRRNTLVINLSGFDGLWSDDEFNAFIAAMQSFLKERLSLESAVCP